MSSICCQESCQYYMRQYGLMLPMPKEEWNCKIIKLLNLSSKYARQSKIIKDGMLVNMEK